MNALVSYAVVRERQLEVHNQARQARYVRAARTAQQARRAEVAAQRAAEQLAGGRVAAVSHQR